MSTARHHAEWLSLVEVSGPFLSLPVLLRVFPQGLDAHDPDSFGRLRQAFEEWQEDRESHRRSGAIHRAWVSFVLSDLLELPEEVIRDGQAVPPGLDVHIPEHHETLRPDFAIVNPTGRPDAGKTRMLCQVLPADQELDRPLPGKEWKASAATRMMELLHGTEVRLGLITNGEQWMVVHAPRGETTTFASWYASLWLEEQITLRAFRSLLGVHRFFGVPDEDTLAALLAESAENQQEVTDQLGYQVRKAVEVVVQSLDRQDKDRGRKLLAGVSENEVYEAALTVMMRLVFLFSAEERGLLLLGDDLYDQHYAVSTLRAHLRQDADQHGEELLERRYDAWCRLLATFRAVYGGMRHDRLQLPAYGGRLFDPDRYPFLEGRTRGSSWRDTLADPLPISNRTVLHLLEALQILQVRVPGGGPAEARRLSFRALDIEQIGHVYEGLLDHSAVRAAEPVLGLQGARDKEQEVPLPELEQLRERGLDELVASLRRLTGRSDGALRRALTAPPLDDDQRLMVACENDQELLQRVRPFAGILREDTSGYPVVIPSGSVYVTQTGSRRTTGTHYTPRSLTEPIVQHTLEPLAYDGPAEGKPRENWRLRSAREILDLEVCDMAMGSGAFLVQACRFLSERLVEAWEAAEKAAEGRVVVTPEGGLSTGAPEERPLPKDAEERLAIARRIIAERCLYGVDKNPMAVEMARLSLWLVTLAKGKPFAFLDHALKCGDSLLGVSLEQLQRWSLDGDAGDDTTGDLLVLEGLTEAIDLRKQIESMADGRVEVQEIKEQLHIRAERALHRMKLAGDLVLTQAFAPKRGRKENAEYAERISALYQRFISGEASEDEWHPLIDLLGDNRPFHWPLEFPEVFLDEERGGFDAFVGNPPFLGGQKITGVLGTPYREYLVRYLGNGRRGSADLCAYFFLQGCGLLRPAGNLGMLATNTIAQGDTREVGLEQIIAGGSAVVRANAGRKWPGTANLEVAVVWLCRGEWNGACILESENAERPVPGITAFLSEPGRVEGTPYRLEANKDRSFQGSIVLGMGFVLTPEEAQALISKDSRSKDVLFPYLNGQDLNSRPDQSPSRWVINFHDWPLDRSAEGRWVSADDDTRKLYLRSGRVPEDYPDPVAMDYRDCMAIVEESVRPERDQRNDEGARRYWWRFLRPRPELAAAIAGMGRVMVVPRVSKYHLLCGCDTGMVFDGQLVILAVSCTSDFSALQSSVHEAWVRRYQSSLETRGRYTPADCFETFALPESGADLGLAGERYYCHRDQVMRSRSEGLTATYNRFHDSSETAEDIAELRRLHVEMDRAVADAYGWEDLELDHGFHETRQGVRFTISPGARQDVLDRLLLLNHQRHAEEMAQAEKAGAKEKPQHGGGKPRRTKRRSRKAASGGPTLSLE